MVTRVAPARRRVPRAGTGAALGWLLALGSLFACALPATAGGGDEIGPLRAVDWAARIGEDWRWRSVPGPTRLRHVPLSRVFALDDGELLALWHGGHGRYGEQGWETVTARWPDEDVLDVRSLPDRNLLVVHSRGVLHAGPEGHRPVVQVDHVEQLSRLVDDPSGPLFAVDGVVHQWRDGELVEVAPAPPGATRMPGLGRTADGTLFASTDAGLWRRPVGAAWIPLETGGLDGVDDDTLFPFVIADHDEVTWLQHSFGLRHPGLHWNGRTLARLSSHLESSDVVAGALAVGDGRVLVGMRESGLRIVRGSRVEHASARLPVEDALRGVALAGTRLAVLSRSGQLSVCDLGSDRWSVHDPTRAGISAAVNALAPARRGGLWIGTHYGVARWDGIDFVDRFTHAGPGGPELDHVTGLAEDRDGTLWVTSGSAFEGVLSWDGTRWTHHTDPQGPGRSSAHGVVEGPDGALWFPLLGPRGAFGDEGGLARWHEGRWTRWTASDGLPHARCYDVAFDAAGTPHVATLRGVARWDGAFWEPLERAGLGVQRIFAMAFTPDGSLWCGRGPAEPGLLRRHPDGAWELLRGAEWERAAAADFAVGDDGRLWFASDYGLFLVSDGRCLPVATGRHDGPPVRSFWPLEPDGTGGLWIGSLGGGLVRLRPDDTTPPLISRRPTSTAPAGSSIHVSWDGQDPWESTRADDLRFEVRLDGGRWIDKGHRRDHVFPHVDPGQHELQVRAVDGFGNVSEPASRLMVLNPIELELSWKPQFMVVFGLLFGVALILYDRTAERRETSRKLAGLNERLRVINRMLMTSQEDERRNLSRNLHDDLGQLLTSICMDLQQCLRTADGTKAAQAVERALEAARGSLERVREISHLLRPRVLDELGLKVALTSALSEFEKRSGLEVVSELDFRRAHVPENVSVHVYRIVQEALTNISKHAAARRLEIRLRCESDIIALEIEDDGAGFDLETLPPDRQFGLMGMRERVEQLEGEFELTSRPGEGTLISVSIPLPLPAATTDPTG